MSKALTALAVEKMKPDPARRLEVPDGLLPGLYLVIQPSGKKSWAARYRADGKPRKLTLGPYPALELDAARDAAREALRQAQKGADPAAAKQDAKRVARERAEDNRDSFDAVARLFLDRYAKPKNRGWKEQARLLGLMPDPANSVDADKPKAFIASSDGAAKNWTGRRIQDISRRDVVDFIDGIVDRGAPVGANRTLAALRKFFAWAVERDIIVTSPAAGIKAPASETHRDRVLSDEELKAIWLAADDLSWPFGPAVQALILTGQRRDEVSGMSWKEIDASGSTWVIPRARAKNDREHDVPVSAALSAVLDKLPKVAGDAKLVFSTNGKTAISGWSKAKTSLDAKALAILRKWAKERGDDPAEVNMADWRLHDLRRTAATGMAKLGINLPVIEKVLNHVSGSFAGIVGVYQRHSFADEKRKALEAWGSFVTALVSSEPKGNVTPMRRAAE